MIKARGFSMIEVLVAITLFVLVLGFVLAPFKLITQKKALLGQKYCRIIESVNLMEALTGVSSTELLAYDGYLFLAGEGEVKVEEFSPTLKKITVWVGEEISPEIKFETLWVDNEE